VLARFEFAERAGIVRVDSLAKLMAADAVDIVHPLAPDVCVISFGISVLPPKSFAGGIFIIVYQ
jgi:hypothetical protein